LLRSHLSLSLTLSIFETLSPPCFLAFSHKESIF
jgi:hypothetical protein